MKTIRHGDVLLKEASGVKSRGDIVNKHTLALGEVTGHSHVLTGAVIPFDINEKKYIEALEALTLTHEEHSTLQIPEGTYEIIIEREYDPFKNELRRVVD